MTYTYFRRFRMEFDLTQRALEPQSLPEGYRFERWHVDWIPAHAQAKYLSFRQELDTNVFPCLGDEAGCLRLMRDISNRDGFLPKATWLIRSHPNTNSPINDGCPRNESHSAEDCAPNPSLVLSMTPEGLPQPVGTIQGIQTDQTQGAIQNIGIVPDHRGRGLGRRLILQSLWGFQQSGLERVILEVTAQNRGAYRLYEQLGFRYLRTVYKCQDIVF